MFFFPFNYYLRSFFVKCVSLLLPKFTVKQHEILRDGVLGTCIALPGTRSVELGESCITTGDFHVYGHDLARNP